MFAGLKTVTGSQASIFRTIAPSAHVLSTPLIVQRRTSPRRRCWNRRQSLPRRADDVDSTAAHLFTMRWQLTDVDALDILSRPGAIFPKNIS